MDNLDPRYGLGLERGVKRLVAYNVLWPQAFAEASARIRAALGSLALVIEHYGSTAVPGLRAKPIIDLQIGVAKIDDGLAFVEPMAALGYDYAGTHMWTAPTYNVWRGEKAIGCIHMSGLFARPFGVAGQDGFRDASSKQGSGL